MKNIVKSLLAAGVLFTTIGCEKDQTATKFNPKEEDAASAYFVQKSVTEEFDASSTGDQVLYVDIYRQNAQGDLTVGLDQTLSGEAAEFFEIPENVTFKNGEYNVKIPVTIKGIENFSKGVNYSATISVGDHHDFVDAIVQRTTQPLKKGAATRAANIAAKYTSVNITTTLTLDWVPCYILKDPSRLLADDLTAEDYVLGPDGKPMIQTGTYTYTFWWNGYSDGVTLERAEGTTVFRMTKWGASEDVNIIFTINPTDKSIVLTNQYIGEDYSDGTPLMVSDVPSLMGQPFDQYPSTWDGGRNFSFSLVYTVEDGRWFGETCVETYELASGIASIEEPAPAVEIDYLGTSVSTTGIKSHTLSFAPNSDAAYYYATVLKVDPELAAQCAEATEAFLSKNGIEPGTAAWYQNYDSIYAQIFEEISGGFAQVLAEQIGSKIEDGSFEGDFPVFKFQGESKEAWDLGTEGGTYTAVAFSYDKTEKYKGVDFNVFIYNPAGDAEKVSYALFFENYPDPASGLFGYNSVYFGLQSENGDITAVKYALLTRDEFEKAGLNAPDADLAGYVDANGKSLAAAALEDVNNTGLLGGYEMYLEASPATSYKLITCISNADATKTEVNELTTDAVAAPTELAVKTAVTDANKGYYSHTHVFAIFSGNEIVNGYYRMFPAADAAINQFITVGADGTVTLKNGVTDAHMIALLEEYGTAFTSGSSTSALGKMNGGDSFIAPLSGKPATRYVVLASANYGNGESSWTAAVQSTAFAPAVAFTQSVEANGRNIAFNWSAAPTASIFAVKKVVYALVPKSVLTEAGVDLSMLSDEQLNDFAARIAAGGDEGEIIMQQQNADKVRAILAAQGKTFQGDAAAAINSEGGVSKEFTNVAAGDYALIALASDSYNTKLTVGQVSIQ